MEAKQRSHFFPSFYIIITYWAFSALTIVMRLSKVRPVLFYCVAVDTLSIDSEIDDSFLHYQSSIGDLNGIFAQESRDVVVITLMSFELEFRLHESEQISVTLYLAGDPALFKFDLIFVAFDPKFPSRIFQLDSIAMALEGEVDLRGVDGDGAFTGFQYKSSGSQAGEVDDRMVRVYFLFILHL